MILLKILLSLIVIIIIKLIGNQHIDTQTLGMSIRISYQGVLERVVTGSPLRLKNE